MADREERKSHFKTIDKKLEFAGGMFNYTHMIYSTSFPVCLADFFEQRFKMLIKIMGSAAIRHYGEEKGYALVDRIADYVVNKMQPTIVGENDLRECAAANLRASNPKLSYDGI